MFCVTCGSRIGRDADFCGSCGIADPIVDRAPAPARPWYGRLDWSDFVAGGFWAVLFAGFVLWAVLSNGSGASPTETDRPGDQDCADYWPRTDFPTPRGDPDDIDADDDGIACESLDGGSTDDEEYVDAPEQCYDSMSGSYPC